MKIERKYMAHYLNATFAADDGTASYVRLGKDLEEYSPELSANVEKKTNILGNETVSIDSYQKQGEVSPYYAEKGDPLFEKLQSIMKVFCRSRSSRSRCPAHPQGSYASPDEAGNNRGPLWHCSRSEMDGR